MSRVWLNQDTGQKTSKAKFFSWTSMPSFETFWPLIIKVSVFDLQNWYLLHNSLTHLLLVKSLAFLEILEISNYPKVGLLFFKFLLKKTQSFQAISNWHHCTQPNPVMKNWDWLSHWHEVITTDCVYKDGKYHQMALIGFGTQTTELGQ